MQTTIPQQQAKREDNSECSKEGLNYLFHIFDFAVGVMFCVDAYVIISSATFVDIFSLPRFVFPLYYSVFGLIIILLIFYAPSFISNVIIFYWTFIGRSLCFLFLSAPLITFSSDLDVGTGVLTAFLGFIYLIFAILTIKRCPTLNVKLPPPIFQRDESLPEPEKNKRKKPQKKWKYKEKEKKKQKEKEKNAKKQSGWRWNKKKNRNNDAIDSGSGGNIENRMGKYGDAINSDSEMHGKLDEIKKERDKDIKTMDSKRKQEATDALSQYADNQAAHIKDINKLNTEIKDINKSNAVQKMCNLGLLSYIFVKRDVFQRYSSCNTYSNMLLNGDNNDDKANDNDYMKMYVLNMMNSGLLTKLTKDQEIEFEKLLLYSLETVDKLYLVELTRSNLNNILLEKIINILIERSRNQNVFGPEIFNCESNRITDNGMKYIINYIAINDKDLKVIKAGHMFTTISSEICKLFGDILHENNQYLLKLSIDTQWIQYQTKIDKSLTRNNDMFRRERNEIFNDDKKQSDHHIVVVPQSEISEAPSYFNDNVDIVQHDNDHNNNNNNNNNNTNIEDNNDDNKIIVEQETSFNNDIDIVQHGDDYNNKIKDSSETQQEIEQETDNNDEKQLNVSGSDIVNNENVINQSIEQESVIDDNYV